MSQSQDFRKTVLLASPREFFVEMVDHGLNKRNVKAVPAVQSYLVSLLEYYLDARNLFDESFSESGERKSKTLAEMFLVAANASPGDKVGLLKKLGDRSLYISGFFGDSLERKIVDIDYYAEMGGAAYGSLADHVSDDMMAQVYRIFSREFLSYVDVLTYISQRSMIQSDQSLLRLYDRYMRTGSELAKEKLIEMGVLTLPQDQAKLARQD
jgi:hypothetical protein